MAVSKEKVMRGRWSAVSAAAMLAPIFTTMTMLTMSWQAVPGQTIAPRTVAAQCASLTPAGSGADGKAAAGGEKDTLSQAISGAGEQDNQEKERVGFVRQLGESCNQRAVRPLIDLLRDPSLAIRVAAIEGLGRLGDPESIDFLVDQAFDEAVEIRMALIGSLASFRYQKAKTTILNSIAHPGGKEITREDELRVRGVAILTLNNISDNTYCYKAITFLHDLGETKNPALLKVIDEIFTALTQTRNGTREMIGILKRHSSPMMRIWMAQRMGSLRLAEARDALSEIAANDRDPQVRGEAEAAIRMIDQPAK